jgi:hypothetical protein
VGPAWLRSQARFGGDVWEKRKEGGKEGQVRNIYLRGWTVHGRRHRWKLVDDGSGAGRSISR